MEFYKSLKEFGTAVGIVLLILVAIISNVAVWNAAAGAAVEGFAVVVSIINFLVELGTLGYLFKKHVLK